MVLRSKAERAKVCWQGRHEIRAVMVSAPVAGWEDGDVGAVEEETEICFSLAVVGESVMSMSCH